MKANLMAALGAALILSTPAWAENSCLMVNQIWSWKAPNDRTLIVEDTWHHKFRLSLMGPCPYLNFKERLGFQAVGGTGLSCLSKGDTVLVRNLGVPQHCPIVDIVPYTAQIEQMDKAAVKAQPQNP
ncbi:MAG TPA: DUF6491 family protein [Rhizomicrobium sp.]|nr:DUF6491 family protein [Rhizomicrobium sp.]